MNNNKIKIALVATSGGHFEQLSNLISLYTEYSHFWITNKNHQTLSELKNEKVYFIKMGHFKRPWTYISHFPFFWTIFKKERPTHIISTGSGRTAFIAFIASKLYNIKFIYIESFSRVNCLSKFGSFLIKSGQKIYTQWETNIGKKAEFIGPVFVNKSEIIETSQKSDYIFVTLGTRFEQFERIIKVVEKLKTDGILNIKVKIQAGYTKYKSELLEIFDFCSQNEIDELIRNSEFVITQESAGIVTKCLKMKKKFIVMPRVYDFGELPSKSDMKEDLQYRLEELGYTKVVNNFEEMKTAIQSIDKIKTGYKFDNSLAKSKLKSLLENI